MRAIFVSYRRNDAEGEAGRLFDELVAAFGKDSVFMDVAAIQAGRDFRKVIDRSVATCGVLLAVIGPSWTDAKDDSGQRRLDDPADFVRLETAAALKRDICVIPVLVRGARMPRPEQLPDDLKDLAYRNCVELTHARWHSDIQLLIQALRTDVEATDGAAAIGSVGGGAAVRTSPAQTPDAAKVDRPQPAPSPTPRRTFSWAMTFTWTILTVLIVAAIGVPTFRRFSSSPAKPPQSVQIIDGPDYRKGISTPHQTSSAPPTQAQAAEQTRRPVHVYPLTPKPTTSKNANGPITPALPTITASAVSDQVHLGEPITITWQTTDSVSVTLTYGNQQIRVPPKGSYEVQTSQVGPGEVKLIATDRRGGEASASVDFQVLPHAKPTAMVLAAVGAGGNFAADTTGQLIASLRAHGFEILSAPSYINSVQAARQLPIAQRPDFVVQPTIAFSPKQQPSAVATAGQALGGLLGKITKKSSPVQAPDLIDVTVNCKASVQLIRVANGEIVAQSDSSQTPIQQGVPPSNYGQVASDLAKRGLQSAIQEAIQRLNFQH